MNKLFKVASVALLATGLSSCLKDKNIEEQQYGMAGAEDVKIIELASDDSHFKMTALDFVNRDTIINFAVVRLAAKDVAQEDIKVTLTLASSSSLIADYNTEHSTSYTQFPSALYTLQGGGLVVTIPKGSREGYLRIRVNPGSFDPSSSYALGFRIASVDRQGYTISQNFGSYIAAIGAKNKYDGKYLAKSYFYHPTVTNQYYWEFNAEMHTSGPNSVKMFDADYFGDYIHPWVTTASGSPVVTGFGLQSPNYTIDPVTNKVTVQNVAAGAATFYTMAPGYDSRYDPATKTIYAKWGYNYSPGPVFNPAANREWTDTLIYVGPR